VSEPRRRLDLELEPELNLSDLLSHVLDKGVVIAGNVTISVAEIDLVHVELSVLLASVETIEQHRFGAEHADDGTDESDADLRVLPPDSDR
jgi:hypothetical protein